MKLAPSQAEQLPKVPPRLDTSTIDLVCIFASILCFYAHVFDSKPVFVYLNPKVRIDKMVDKHLKQQLTKLQRYIFSYFYQLLKSSLKPLYFTKVGKNFRFYGVQISIKCIEPMHLYTWPPPQSKLSTKFLSLPSPQTERQYYSPPGSAFSKICFPGSRRG